MTDIPRIARALAALEADMAHYFAYASLRALELEMNSVFSKAGFKPDQPRVPAGQPGGGRWSGGGTPPAAPHGWGNAGTLLDHVERHGKDFGIASGEEYARQAREFYTQARNGRFRAVIDEYGVFRAYDPKTNTFGSFNSDGTTRTYYKPSGGARYFRRQMEKYSVGGGRVIEPVGTLPARGGGGGGAPVGGFAPRIGILKPKIN
jgi:hypothetical protein